jgi:biopolymer transport protein ExbD
MRFKGRMELEHGLKTIDIAPLVNVVFLLLIFIMLTGSLISQPGMKVDLPRAVTSEAVKPLNLEVLITADNSAYLNGKVVTDAELKAAFAQLAKRKLTVLIKADRRAQLGRAVVIWDMARSAGVSQVNIATNQE